MSGSVVDHEASSAKATRNDNSASRAKAESIFPSKAAAKSYHLDFEHKDSAKISSHTKRSESAMSNSTGN